MAIALRMATWVLAVLLGLSTLPMAGNPSGPYSLQPLITSASPVSDLPGGKIMEVGGIFPLRSGELVFWGKLAGREESGAWALLSWKAGRIRTLLEEGTEVTSRYADTAYRFNVHRSVGRYAQLEPRNGKWLYFTKTLPKLAQREMSVFAWDGEWIRPILQPGQSLRARGRELPVEWAVVRDIDPDGNAILEVATKAFRVHMVHDGASLRELFPGQLVLEGGEVISSDGVKAWKLLPKGELLAQLQVGRRELGLYHLTGSKARKILASGDPNPLYPGESILWATATFAQTSSRFVAQVCSGKDNRRRNLLWDEGKIHELPSPQFFGLLQGHFVIQNGRFLAPGSPLFLFHGNAFRSGPVAGTSFTAAPEAGTQLCLFDGNTVRGLTKVAHLDTSFRTGIGPVLRGDFRGVLVRHYLGPGPLPKIDTLKQFPPSFLDLSNLDAGLQPPPELTLTDGRTLSLGQLIEWPGSDGMVARLPDGLYRLERVGAGAPKGEP